jgi:uncharacterized membrane protein
MDRSLALLAVVAALGCGLVAGVFFAFSTFVIKALARLAPANGIAAMQSINIVVINPWFLALFLGTGAVCVATSIAALLRWQHPGAGYLLTSGLCYLVGTLWVTIRCNVPMNNALAKLLPDDSHSVALWADYVRRWTAWNHVRAAASVVAAAGFILALGH